ncbi:hypothetical protein SEA_NECROPHOXINUS_74 [Microbacterium phage Necrophoxinus]|nr:hypothetical protein SEA_NECROPHOXINUS_74 [Microbacterium phage Necrophoxinus]
MTDNEYAIVEDDLKGGGNSTAKPRGVYTAAISKAASKADKNKKVYIGFGLKILLGKFKNGLLFENYLPLARDVNKFQAARRNSFYKAIGLKAGAVPYGAPGGPQVDLLNGTVVDIQVEHEFEQVPGEEYSITTSKSAKSKWVTEGWEAGLDDKGRLVKSPGGTVYDAPISPKESLTFYNLSDEFDGVGDPDGAPAEDDQPDEDWG